MNLLNIISNEEPIGGLEIAGDSLRFSKLKRDKSGLKIELLAEEKIIQKNSDTNQTALSEALTKLAKKNGIKYIIVSIPTDYVYTKIYSFPLAMADEKIAESIKLTIDLQLPQKPENIYCGWMKIESKEDKKILLSYSNKTYTDDLILKLKKADLKIVAIENHSLSLARIIKQKPEEIVLIAEKGLNNTSFSLIKNNSLFFASSVPNKKVADGLTKEIKKIINYYDWLNIEIKDLILLGNFTASETKKLPLKIKTAELNNDLKQLPDTKWIISLGAALRGLLPRKDDKIISFMEIGTETAYRQEKAKATINFFMGTSVALAIFFVTIFLVAWYLIMTMSTNYNNQISSFNLSPSADTVSNLRDKASTFNDLIGQTSSLIKKEPIWSKIITETKDRITAGIIFNNLTFSGANNQFSVSGSADNREAINTLQKSFESSELFSEVNIPLNNLAKKVDIPFLMTFKIKNPQLIYPN